MTFQAVDEFDKSLMLWKAELNNLDDDLRAKDKIEARVQDLYRNDALTRGLIEKQVDTVIGSKVAIQAMPDYAYLGAQRDEVMRWQALAESEFHRYAYSPENWISADRSMDFTQLLRCAERTRIMTGEMFVSREWRVSPIGYNTCFNPFSPNRVKTPKQNNIDGRIFHGIEFDEYGSSVAFHIEEARLNQKRNFGLKEIKRVSKYSAFNWLQVFHLYEPLLPEYPRGISRMAAVLLPMKQMARYKEADLDKNIIAANYVMAITSDEDPESVADMLAGVGSAQSSLDAALGSVSSGLPPEIERQRQEILSHISQRFVELRGGHLLHLFKGEEAKIMQAPVASQTSADYAKGYARDISNGMGISYELGSGDFDGVSFAGGQMSLGIYEHGANIQRQLYAYKLAKLMYRSWLDEAMTTGKLPLIADKPYFQNREAYANCEVTGAKRVHVDPVKSANSNAKKLASGYESRTAIANAEGVDIESIIMDRANEADMYLDAIMTVAERNNLQLGDDAKLKIITDLVATSSVTTPDNITDPQGMPV